MPNHTMQSIIVSGINEGGDSEYITVAYQKAVAMFEPGLVAITSIGHNFVQSFCIFPTGSGNRRPPQLVHQQAIDEFCLWLASTDLEYVAVRWGDTAPAMITATSET